MLVHRLERLVFLELRHRLRRTAILQCCSPLRIHQKQHVHWRCTTHFLRFVINSRLERRFSGLGRFADPLTLLRLVGLSPRFLLLEYLGTPLIFRNFKVLVLSVFLLDEARQFLQSLLFVGDLILKPFLMCSCRLIFVLSLHSDALLHHFNVFQAHSLLLGSLLKLLPFFNISLLPLNDRRYLILSFDDVCDALLLGLLITGLT